MSEGNERTPAWGAEFTGVLDEDVGKSNRRSYRLAEMSVEFGKGLRDVVKQSVLRDDSEIVKKLKGPCANICRKLRFLNEYLPEDRDPCQAWSVIAFVWVLALAALIGNANQNTTTPWVKKMKTHPASASLILLPDGRHLAYQEKGAFADQAPYTMIDPHSFLSSRLAGIPGVNDSLLQEFGVRLLTYDLPGFGESDPHPGRNLESSALDMLHLSYAVNVPGKFWVVAHSDGSIHVWSALRYIPDKVEAGAIMVAPMINPYETRLTKEERRMIWPGEMDCKEKNYCILVSYSIEKWLSLIVTWKEGFGLAFQHFRPQTAQAAAPGLRSVYGLEEERVNGFLGPIHVWQEVSE